MFEKIHIEQLSVGMEIGNEDILEAILEDSYKAEELPAGALFTTKIAPAFNGRTSWFAYEELIEEFLDVTILDGEKIGPALRSRLIGDAIQWNTRNNQRNSI